MFKPHILKKRLVVMFVLAVLLPVITASCVTAGYLGKMLEDEREKTLSTALSAACENIDLYLNDLLRMSAAPLLYSEMMDVYRLINDGRLTSGEGDMNLFLSMRDYEFDTMRLLYNARDGVIGLSFYPYSDLDSAYYISKNYGNYGAMHGLPADKQPWFNKVIEGNGRGVLLTKSTSVLEKNSPEMFSAARMIVNISDQKPIGILKIDAHSSAVKQLLKTIDDPGNSIVALVDGEGVGIYSTRPLDQQTLNTALTGNERINIQGESYDPIIGAIGTTGWKLLYLSSRRDISEKSAVVLFVAGITAMVCILLGLLFFRRYSLEILQGVNEILSVMKRVEKGDLTPRIAVQGTDELALIGGAFNSTVEKLEQHIKSEYVAQLNRKNAEYMALRSQINPHFLYNTLTCFVGLNRMGEKKQLERSIIQLTNLLRFSCKNEDTVTVGSEAEFLRNYLQLMQIRYEERLSFTINIQPEAQMCVIPKLLLQPLVENAIVHGMEPYDINITIAISASVSNGRLRLTVSDDGMGFDMQAVDIYGSVGISSVRERLRLTDENAEFRIESHINKGTFCVITLPEVTV